MFTMKQIALKENLNISILNAIGVIYHTSFCLYAPLTLAITDLGQQWLITDEIHKILFNALSVKFHISP